MNPPRTSTSAAVSSDEISPVKLPPARVTKGDLPLILVAVLPPMMPVLAFLIEWLVAWVTLGHIPRGGVDDPKSISTTSSILHNVTALCLLGFLPVSALAVWACAVKWEICRKTFIIEGMIFAMVVGTFVVLAQFPHDAMGWWLD
jgi:hypothetical protein